MCMSGLPACICTACMPKEIRRGYCIPSTGFLEHLSHGGGGRRHDSDPMKNKYF